MKDSDFKVGITAGVFDLCHHQHLLMFKYAKERCDYLIVAVQVDPSKYREGKQPPIETIFERFVRLESCKYIDKVVPYETEEDLEDILRHYDYSIRFVGSDHQGHSFTGDTIKPDTIHYNPRDHKHSSSALKERVKKGRTPSLRPLPKEKPENVDPEDNEDNLSASATLAKRIRKERKGK